MRISCVLSLEDIEDKEKELFYEVLKSVIKGDIKSRAVIEIKDTTIEIKAKDITAFKIAINSLLRFFNVMEGAWQLK